MFVAGDIAMAIAAFVGISKFATGNAAGASMVAILTSSFTAISTMTTAYFGIKTISNTAQSFAKQMPEVGLAAQPKGPEGSGSGGPVAPQPGNGSGDTGEPVPQPAT